MKGSGMSGLAVLEGILVKNRSKYALAVRKPDDDIEVLTGRVDDITEKNAAFSLPFIRGIVSLVEMIWLIVKNFSVSEKFYDKEEGGKIDSRETKELLTVIAVISLAIGLFFALPYGISLSFYNVINSDIALTFIEGIMRLVLIVLYIFGISMLPEIKRVYMYLGALHKAMNCVDKGLPLTLSNVKKMNRRNYRCAATFLAVVIALSILVFMFVRIDNIVLRIVIRLLTVPIIAGLTYEIMEIAARGKNSLADILNLPAMLIQSVITAEPEDEMIEVAIESVSVVAESKEEVKEEADVLRELYKPLRAEKAGIKRVSKDKALKTGKPSVTTRDKKSAGASQKAGGKTVGEVNSEKKNDTDISLAERAKQSLDVKEGVKTVKISEDEDDEILNALNHFFNSKKEEEKKRGKRKNG